MRDLKYWEANLSGDLKSWLELTRAHSINEDYFNALSSYFNLLENLPADEYQCVYEEFVECLRICRKLNTTACIQLGIAPKLNEYYPESVDICVLHAQQMFITDQILKSVQLYEQALQLMDQRDEDKIRLLIESENVRSHLFDQWHFPMLNDKERNCQFGQAIKECVQELSKLNSSQIHIVDLGCGTGILATMISNELANYQSPTTSSKISAIDSNPVMIHVADQVFARNNVSIQAHCLHSKEFNSNVPINLIVSETLDCALFGERFVSSLLDLHKRLGSSEHFQVLPQKATFYLALCECPYVERQHFCEKTSNENNKYVLLSNECYLNWPMDPKDGLNDPYDSVQLGDLKEGYQLLSEPLEAFTVDFNDFDYLQNVIMTNKFCKRIKLVANKSGRASCVVGWFRLQIYKDTFVETKPTNGMCWPQAVYPFYPPTQLSSTSSMDFQLCINDEKLYICPLNLPNVECEKKIRIKESIDFQALNSREIHTFFQKSIDCWELNNLLDMTDLIIEVGSNSKVAYVTTSEHLLKLDYLNVKLLNEHFEFPSTTQAILHWPFNSFGCFDETRLDYLNAFVQHFKLDNHIRLVPFKFRLKGMLIRSDQLMCKSSLIPNEKHAETYNQVDITPMQKHYIRHFHELNLNELEYEQMSEIGTLFECEFEKLITSSSDQVQHRQIKLNMLKPNSKSHALIHWLELYSTNTNESTDNPMFSFQQLPSCTSAFIFEKEVEFKEIVDLKTFMFQYQFHFEFL